MSATQGERRPSAVRAVATAFAVALVGVLTLLASHDVSARTGPERSANSLVGASPDDRFGTTPPAGAARGSELPGLTTSPAPGATSADAEGEAPPGTPPDAGTVPPASVPGGPTSKVIHLTFDDGPDPVWTPQVLAVLKQYGVHATFFELGVQVKEHPSLPALVRRDGHRIGNHTYSHKSLPGLDPAHLRAQIERGPDATCLRPPFGAVDGRVRAAAARAGQTIVLWDVDTRDWAKPGVKHIVNEALKHAHPGATILMHDAGGDRSETVAALRIVVPRLLAEGYTFATVPGC